jgi:hypothetical protein
VALAPGKLQLLLFSTCTPFSIPQHSILMCAHELQQARTCIRCRLSCMLAGPQAGVCQATGASQQNQLPPRRQLCPADHHSTVGAQS